MIKVGLMDLETCHSKFNSETSLELKSLILSLVSALFVFLSLAKKRGDFSEAHHRMMISIFDSMFKCLQIEDSSTREIRRHSAALLIKVWIKIAFHPRRFHSTITFILYGIFLVGHQIPRRYGSSL